MVCFSLIFFTLNNPKLLNDQSVLFDFVLDNKLLLVRTHYHKLYFTIF